MAMTPHPVTLPDSAFYDLPSTVNHQNYRVFVGGVQSGTGATVPRTLVFVLDANWLFASVYEYLRTLSLFDPSIGNPVIVGIGYPGDETNMLLTYRERDLAPVPANTTNINNFFTFINHEVPEFLNTELGINADRKILAGHSWGGAFTLYAMAAKASTFTGYLASSPLILGTVMEEIEQFVENLSFEKPTKLFSSMGSDEKILFPQIALGFPRLEQALEQTTVKQLEFQLLVFAEENHSSITLTALSRGLRYLLC